MRYSMTAFNKAVLKHFADLAKTYDLTITTSKVDYVYFENSQVFLDSSYNS